MKLTNSIARDQAMRAHFSGSHAWVQRVSWPWKLFCEIGNTFPIKRYYIPDKSVLYYRLIGTVLIISH